MITLELLPTEDVELNIDVVGGGGTYNYNKLKNKPSINDVELVGNLTSRDLNLTSEGIEYSNDEHPDITNVDEALDNILHKIYYVHPQITSFGTGSTVLDNEIGYEIPSVVFNWTTNKEVVKQSLTGVVLGATDRSATYSVPFSANKTFTLVVDDGENTASATKTFRFLPKVYCGVAVDNGNYDSAFVVGLGGSLKTGKAGTYSLNIGVGEYGFIASPKTYGKITKCVIGGFDMELIDCGVVSVTNQSGYTQDYYLYKTPNSNLGSISMVIS